MIVSQEEIHKIYTKLYDIGKNINELVNTDELYDIACDFSTKELNFEKALIFEHDDSNGWFKVVKSFGYENPIEQKMLKIINLLLSGEVIEYLRTKNEPIIYTTENPKKEVESLLKSLFLSEAYLELIGGDSVVPHGLIIVGNSNKNIENYTKLIENSSLLLALGNFTVQLSNSINNIIFYKGWQEEKIKLEENIKIRTKQIEEQKKTFEAIYKTSKDGMAILDLETSAFLDVNNAYCEMTGFTKEELQRTSCLKLSRPEDLELSKKALNDVKTKGFLKNFEKICVVKDKKEIIVNMSMTLLEDKKTVFVSSKDVTENKKLEKELQEINKNLENKVQEQVEKNRRNEFHLLEQSKNASMGEMIGNIAHQWRQPLSAITSLASSIKLHTQLNIINDEEIYDSMDKMINKANYLSETVETFRNFLKVDKNKKEFILEETIKNSLQIVEATMKDYHIIINQDIDYKAKSYITGIESEVSQVIINILNNAKDILREKKITRPIINISLENDNETAILSIEDNGGGIPLDVLPRIFEPYFTTKHQSQGTGLGLHMSFRIINESFDGKLYAKNTAMGAKFYIEIPTKKL